jgi:hypothetical protein
MSAADAERPRAANRSPPECLEKKLTELEDAVKLACSLFFMSQDGFGISVTLEA